MSRTENHSSEKSGIETVILPKQKQNKSKVLKSVKPIRSFKKIRSVSPRTLRSRIKES